ncbi:MAG: XTP/dITP diphosphatase [Thermoanaerobacteraceae bacterium]|nr:XTP/dITP diphosphatase [Thermoanaerobacteraceae bacterium]
MRWVAATNNYDKLREIRNILCAHGIEVLSLKEVGLDIHVVEDGSSFKENAFKKAIEVHGSIKLPALADDSGLVVDALGGRPGIYSARYAGENASDSENNKKLLEELEGIPMDQRKARYVCAMVLVENKDRVYYGIGECEGYILEKPRGDNGFGYDPLFYIPELGKTFAEIPEEKKNAISHRSMAIKNLLQKMTLR